MSNGARLTHIDWRANRLADGLAKMAASDGAPPRAVLRLLRSAQAGIEYSAKLLGRVTYAANHHVVQRTDGEGKLVKQTFRDSAEAPRGPRAKAGPRPKPKAKPVAKPGATREVKPWKPPSHAAVKHSTTAPAGQMRKREAKQAARQAAQFAEDNPLSPLTVPDGSEADVTAKVGLRRRP